MDDRTIGPNWPVPVFLSDPDYWSEILFGPWSYFGHVRVRFGPVWTGPKTTLIWYSLGFGPYFKIKKNFEVRIKILTGLEFRYGSAVHDQNVSNDPSSVNAKNSKLLCSAEIETVSEKCKNLKTHLKAVRDELNNNLSMRQMRQNEVNTEKVGAREHIPHH